MRRTIWIGSLVALATVALALGARHRPAAARLGWAELGEQSYQTRLGADVYRYYCETCHGAEGRGDGFNAFNLDPKPPDFTAPGFRQSRSTEQLRAGIEKGGKAMGRSAAMPPWGRTLSASQVRAVLRHIQRLASGQRDVGDQRPVRPTH
jgi:mono/diheme cytochrome c family protein